MKLPTKLIPVPFLETFKKFSSDKVFSDSTQSFVPIADIVDGITILKSGGAAIVMESSSLNFSLLSEREQQAVIAAYAALLNSLSFPIQIVIRSQRKDISNYLKYLEEAKTKVKNEKVAAIMSNYITFVSETIKKKNVLGKTFYLVIPLNPLELGVSKSLASFVKRSGSLPFTKSYVVKKAKTVLYPRRDHLIRQGGRIGLAIKQLSTEKLIELYYKSYNPEPPYKEPTENEI